MNKKATSVLPIIISTIILLALIVFGAFTYNDFSKQLQQPEEQAALKLDLATSSNLGVLAKTNIFLSDYLPYKLGFKTGSEKFMSFWVNFVRGFLGALILWIIYSIIKIFRIIAGKSPIGQDQDEYREKTTIWFNVVSGKLWKIPVTAVFFAVAMQIPILNTIMSYILLDWLIDPSNWLVRSFMVCFWIGLGPGFIENFMKNRFQLKLEKKVQDARIASRKSTIDAGSVRRG